VPRMVTGFDLLSHDGRLRRHWQKRAAAFIIDAISIFIPLLIILWFAGVDDIIQIGILSSMLFYIISLTEEATMKGTVGKYAMGLRVKAIRPGIFSMKVVIRNVNRLLWFILPPLDFTLGMATKGDPRQRMLDRLAGTTVIVLAETDWHEGHMRKFEKQDKPSEEDTASEEEPTERSAKDDLCHECSGPLIQLADENYQCRKCGLIQ